MVRPLAHNQQHVGSNPTTGTLAENPINERQKMTDEILLSPLTAPIVAVTSGLTLLAISGVFTPQNAGLIVLMSFAVIGFVEVVSQSMSKYLK